MAKQSLYAIFPRTFGLKSARAPYSGRYIGTAPEFMQSTLGGLARHRITPHMTVSGRSAASSSLVQR